MFGKYLQNKEQLQDLGYRCIWYVKLCFQKEMITG